MVLFKLLIISTLYFACRLQIVPESVKITNLPDQSQDFYHGWLNTANQPESYLYYQLFSADGTTLDASDQNTSQIPLLLYLEGGPGHSSVFNMWSGFGPYGINSNMNFTGNNTPEDLEFSLYKRDLTWTRFCHLLAIDSPIQTGYSFSIPEAFLNNTDDVVNHLIVFLKRFYEIYPQLLENSLYIVGDSYGGHWAALFPYKLMKDHNLDLGNGRKINLVGSIFLVPYIDAKMQANTEISDYLFAAGLTSPNNRETLRNMELELQQNLQSNKLDEATQFFFKELASYLNRVPGDPLVSNFPISNSRLERTLEAYPLRTFQFYVPVQTYFNVSIPMVKAGRELLNIPTFLKFYMMGYCGKPFEKAGDFMLELDYAVEYILDRDIKILIFASQDDNLFPAPALIKLVGLLNWKGAQGFKESKRNAFKSEEGDVLAYSKHYQNLKLVTVCNAGHIIIENQPERVFDFISAFTTKNK